VKLLIAFLFCVGIGYIAEIHFENPEQYVVWGGFTFITFGAYLYLTHVTSFAFALPVTTVLIGIASAFAWSAQEVGYIIFGIYGSIGVLILAGGRFLSWRWSDWKSPAKVMEALSGSGRSDALRTEVPSFP